MQDQYDLEEKNVSFIAQSNFIYKNQLIGLGLNNFADYVDPGSKYETNSDRYTVTTTWGIRPASGKWFADLGIDAVLFRGSLVGFNKLVRVSRDFHDARVEFTALIFCAGATNAPKPNCRKTPIGIRGAGREI